jgi:hypothetical protein
MNGFLQRPEICFQLLVRNIEPWWPKFEKSKIITRNFAKILYLSAGRRRAKERTTGIELRATPRTSAISSAVGTT